MPFRGHGKLAQSWWAGAPPTFVSIAAATYVGVTFIPGVAGRIMGLAIFLDASDNTQHWAILEDHTLQSTRAARSFFPIQQGASAGWRNLWLRPSIRVIVGHQYRLHCLTNGSYHRQNAALTSPVTHNNLQFINSFQTTAIDPVVVTITTNTNANGVDVLFQAD